MKKLETRHIQTPETNPKKKQISDWFNNNFETILLNMLNELKREKKVHKNI